MKEGKCTQEHLLSSGQALKSHVEVSTKINVSLTLHKQGRMGKIPTAVASSLAVKVLPVM